MVNHIKNLGSTMISGLFAIGYAAACSALCGFACHAVWGIFKWGWKIWTL